MQASISTSGSSLPTSSTTTAGRSAQTTCPADPQTFLRAIQPFRDGLLVDCACLFAWLGLADLCEEEAIPFVLGHALFRKAIHGAKTKTGRIDAGKLAGLLRSLVASTGVTKRNAFKGTVSSPISWT